MELMQGPSATSVDVNTLLIVDDDEINRGILSNLFSPYYQIEEAENGRAGLSAILAGCDHLCAVLLDVVMPDMSGLEVLQRLRETDGTLLDRLPVFLITAEADAAMNAAYEMGVMDVISKPVVPYLVLRRVNSVVELFQIRRRLENRVEQQDAELLEKRQQLLEVSHGRSKPCPPPSSSAARSPAATSSASTTSLPSCSPAQSSAPDFRRRRWKCSPWPLSCTMWARSPFPTPSWASRAG